MNKRILGSCVLFVLLATLLVPALSSGQLKIDQKQRYYFLVTTKTATMQKELDQASGMGFRVISGCPGGENLAVLLERVAQPPDLYRYTLLATSNTGTMQKELSEAAAQGYRVLPSAVMTKKMPMLNNWEIVFVLERSPKVEKNMEYLLLATSRESTMLKEMEQAIGDGYRTVGIVGRGELMILLEREAKTPPAQ
jgi:hypothetical protein